MARSYFSRMVRGGGVVALAPSRPVSNLWKSAQMEGTAIEAAVEAPAEGPARRVRVAAAVEPEVEPVVRSSVERPGVETPGVERKTEAFEVTPVRSRQTRKLPEIARQENSPREMTTREAARLEPDRHPTVRERRAELVTGELVTREPAIAEPAVPPVERPKLDVQESADILPHLEPARARQQEPLARAQREATVEIEHAVATVPEVKREAATVLTRSTEPVRHRERAAWNAPAQEESRGSSGNSVQIGKIEVQVISPPAPVRYVAAPAAPKGRLARGYTLWQAWQ